MFPDIRRNTYIQKFKPLIKPVYFGIAKQLNFVFEYFICIAIQILRFIFGIELINALIFIAPKSFIKAILKSCGCIIGKNTDILPHIIINNANSGNYSNLIIGDGCFIGKGVYFDLVELIELGDNSTISARTTILTHEDPGPNNDLKNVFPRKTGKVIIGENSWIGISSTILCGVSIGDHTLIGASSLVLDDIPSYSVAVGVPAKVIKKIGIR